MSGPGDLAWERERSLARRRESGDVVLARGRARQVLAFNWNSPPAILRTRIGSLYPRMAAPEVDQLMETVLEVQRTERTSCSGVPTSAPPPPPPEAPAPIHTPEVTMPNTPPADEAHPPARPYQRSDRARVVDAIREALPRMTRPSELQRHIRAALGIRIPNGSIASLVAAAKSPASAVAEPTRKRGKLSHAVARTAQLPAPAAANTPPPQKPSVPVGLALTSDEQGGFRLDIRLQFRSWVSAAQVLSLVAEKVSELEAVGGR